MGSPAGLERPGGAAGFWDRLVLGTVQLGLPYGRRRGADTLSAAEAEAVLERAWELGIRAFDTSEGYGTAVERLGEWLGRRGVLRSAKVVTKVRCGEPAGAAQRALVRFEGAARVTLLSHGHADAECWRSVRAAAEHVGAEAGQSVYGPEEVELTCRLSGVSRIQAPGNVVDQRAIAARGGSSVALDLRSVFLQGVLLDPAETAESRVRGGARLSQAVQASAAEAGLAAAPLLVAAMLQRLRAGDRLVIGVDDPEQLDVVAAGVTIEPSEAEGFSASVRRRLGPIEATTLDPRTW